MVLSPATVLVTLALAAPNYGALRGSAESVPNLGRFLERYLGDCESTDPSFDKKGCEAAAAVEQRKYQDRTLVLEVDSPEEQLQFAGFDSAKGAFRLHLTPFFGERALALSVGKPDRLNKDGLPIVKLVPIWVKLPEGETEFAFQRQLERGMVRLELLVKPKKAWRIKRKDGEGDYRGVEVALAGVRVYPQRGQNVLAEQTY